MRNLFNYIISILIIFNFRVELIFGQWITNHNLLLQPNLVQPSNGGYVFSPVFGTNIFRITDARKNHLAGCFPQYSKRQAFNSDESLLLIFTADGGALLFDGINYNFIKALNYVEGEDVFWHPYNPYIILYSYDNSLYQYNINNDSLKLIRTFNEFSFINTRGEGNLSNDAKYYAFVGQVYDSLVHFKDIIVYDIEKDSVISKLSLPPTLEDFDWVSISPNGNFVVVDYATSNTGRFQGVEVYDRNMNFIWQKPLGAGHSDLAIDANGDEVLIMDYYDEDQNENIIKKFRLLDGAETNLLNLSWDFDLHISARNESRRGWCFISTFDGEARLVDNDSIWLPFEDEVFALKMDGSQSVQRICHHYSKRFSPLTPDRDNSVYWAEPHATISRDGGRILFGSNWRKNINQDTSVDAYIVDFRNWLNIKEEPIIKNSYLILNNYPNPFNSSTNIHYKLERKGFVNLKIYDVLSRLIEELDSGEKATGDYNIIWNANQFSSGIYYCRLSVNNVYLTHKMILLK